MHISPHQIHGLIWNSFLALIPVAAGYAIYALHAGRSRHLATKAAIVLLGLVWLAFMPNTCYLLTEWRHFLRIIGYTSLYDQWYMSKTAAVRLMIYTLFYMFYSGIGVLTFALAIRPVAQVLKERKMSTWMLTLPFFLLMSLGVYLGLILRLNSWDIVTRPEFVWASIVATLGRPGLISLIAAFAAFLWALFLATDIWIDGFRCRLTRKPIA